jgi:hypothetical protein
MGRKLTEIPMVPPINPNELLKTNAVMRNRGEFSWLGIFFKLLNLNNLPVRGGKREMGRQRDVKNEG